MYVFILSVSSIDIDHETHFRVLRGMRPDLSFGVDMFFIVFGFSADTFPGGEC